MLSAVRVCGRERNKWKRKALLSVGGWSRERALDCVAFHEVGVHGTGDSVLVLIWAIVVLKIKFFLIVPVRGWRGGTEIGGDEAQR